jgi:mercuric ion binding protein
MMIKTVFLTLSLISTPFLMQAAQAELPVKTQAGNQSVTLDVRNMTCPMCKFTVRKALLGMDGVNKVEVDYDAKTATVSFNPQKTSADALIKAATNAGYPATVSRQ